MEETIYQKNTCELEYKSKKYNLTLFMSYEQIVFKLESIKISYINKKLFIKRFM